MLLLPCRKSATGSLFNWLPGSKILPPLSSRRLPLFAQQLLLIQIPELLLQRILSIEGIRSIMDFSPAPAPRNI